MTRVLHSNVVDAELVIRDHRPWWLFVVLPSVVGIQVLHPGHQYSWRDTLYVLIPLLMLLLEALFWRPWIRIGPHRISFRRGLRGVHYPWEAIESFEIGNPVRPTAAYLLLASRRDGRAEAGRREVVRLPWFFAVRPLDLVALLNEKRGRFVKPRGGQPPSLPQDF